MEETFLPGIATEILKKLGSRVLEEIGLVWGFKDELSKLRGTVSTIQAELLDAQKQQETNHRVKNWLEKLGDAFDDADNLLGEFFTEHLRREVMARNKRAKKVRIFFSSKNQLAFRVKMAHKIKSIREKLDAIAKDRIQFNFIPQQVSIMPQVQVMGELDRETHGSVITEEIIGRNHDKHQIIKLLSDPNNQEHVSIIPIVGIGGIGKTTLAQLVFNDEGFVKQFEKRMWVCVSDVFNAKLIVEKMIESATGKKPNYLQLDRVQVDLKEIINGKKYLLVLDDMWDDCVNGWSYLRSLLMGGAGGSMILVTTRSHVVAKITGTFPPHHLGNLSEDDAWSFFKRLAFKKDDELSNSWKLEVGREIVKKCVQVPLAIKAIGSLLYIKDTEQEWLHFRDNDLVNISQEEDVKIMQILRLSYDHLPLPLKPCFAYCSLYPKDDEIDKDKLIMLWIAQGFVKSLDGRRNLEDIGELYFMELLRRSFFQEVKKDEWNNIKSYKMHDLIHYLAQHVAGTECSSVDLSSQINVTERTRHVSCTLSSFAVKSQEDDGKKMYTATKLRTFLGPSVRTQELKKICSTFKRLRVLDVALVNFHRDSDCMNKLHKLKHLQYLQISLIRSRLTNLPRSITRLRNLQTLKLDRCGLVQLREDIGELACLRHLDLSDNQELSSLPSSIGKLQNMRTLKLDSCGLERLPEGIIELVSLTHLDLSKNYKLSNLPSSIVGLQNLLALKLKSCGLVQLPENIGELASLRHLDLSYNSELPNLPSSIGGLQNLHTLKLKSCGLVRLPEDIGELANLRHLDLSYNSELSNFPSSFGGLHNLHTLLLSDCMGLKELPKGINQLVSLRHLDNSIPGLTNMGRGLGQLTSLQRLEKFVVGEEQAGENGAAGRLSELKGLNNLEGDLRIERLEMVSHAEIEQVILNSSTHLLKDKHHLKSLGLSWRWWSEDAERLLEGLQPHPNLEELWISGYGGVNLASWIGQLPSLRSLAIGDCERLTCLSEGFGHLTALRTLDIYDCKELDLSDDYHGMQFLGLSNLTHLTIRGMPKLASLPVGLQHITTLQSLSISECANLVTLTDWIANFPSLRFLFIRNCPELTSLPVCLQRITTLQNLSISACANLVTLPDWIGNFTSLQSLSIDYCPKLTSLPESVRCLRALQALNIIECSQLEQRCMKETGQDWPNIAHIPRIDVFSF